MYNRSCIYLNEVPEKHPSTGLNRHVYDSVPTLLLNEQRFGDYCFCAEDSQDVFTIGQLIRKHGCQRIQQYAFHNDSNSNIRDAVGTAA